MKDRETHDSESGTLEPDADGWYHARCTCGWRFEPLPDAETVLDALMDHVAEVEFERWLEEANR